MILSENFTAENVTNMEVMFMHNAFTELDLSMMKTSDKLVNCGEMFAGCSNLESLNIIPVSKN